MRQAVNAFAVSLVFLAGCATQQQAFSSRGESPAHASATDRGIALLFEGRAKEASAEFNRALARMPDDANLHFLNGLAYRQIERESGKAVSELAETGYRLALEFDSGHWLAAWHLGLIQVEQRQYAEARRTLARAARLQPRNPDIQLALAGSAYLASDAPVALLSAEKTLALRPKDPEALKIAALASAALGMESGAYEYSDRFREVRPAEAEMISDRLDTWKKAYAQALPAAAEPSRPAASPQPNVPPGGLQAATPSAAPLVEQGPLAPGWSDCPQSRRGWQGKNCATTQ
jgi:Tfp pilus assembly protein PilF